MSAPADAARPDEIPQPTPMQGLRAVVRFTRPEHARFAASIAALVAAAGCLYAVPLIPQSVFDILFAGDAEPSALSRRILTMLGGEAGRAVMKLAVKLAQLSPSVLLAKQRK